ncbi:MAG TPA: fibronectin type III domain-containing protein [Pirellulales bacterium]|jgi:subtilase family serine protease|nr:fibronectin type III domain-containing protein [Pirellulales bacterium]
MSKSHRQSQSRRPRRLQFEILEARQLLSASTFTPFYHTISSAPLASSTTAGYTPAQIRAAYGFNSVSFGSTAADGKGQTIAIIDAYNDPNITADLAVFDAAYGIAAPPSFSIVNQNGGTSLPGTDPSQGWEGEIALDVEWAHAIAPGANIILVEANSASDSDLFAAVNWARNQAAVSVISMSWGSDDNSAYKSNDQSLSNTYLVTPAGHQGITFVASSGDDGHPNFPSESPNVLAVGGTDLYLTSSGAITSETAWTPTTSGGQTWSGGGGTSTEFSGRKVPDVSYNAGVAVAVYDTFGPDHGWVGIGGTSAGAPQWAALIAIADEGRALNGQATLNGATQTLAALYAAPSADFHDITSGSTQFQSAAVGYDLATGIGTPAANLLIPYLTTYGTTVAQPTAPAAPGSFTAQAVSSSQVNLSWSLSSGATSYSVYELINGKSSLLTTLSATASSLSVSGLAASTTYSFQVVATNAVGSTATNWAQATTQAAAVAVAAPKNVTATVLSPTSVQLNWSAVTGATGYYVYQLSGSSYIKVATVAAPGTTATINNLASGTTVSFYVVAYNATSTASSSMISAVLPTAAALSPPANLTAAATSTTTGSLSWNASAGATRYAIYYWNGRASVLLGYVSSSTTSVTITGLKAGSTTYFAVAAQNATTTATSDWVALTTPLKKVTAAAQLLAAQLANQKYYFGW